MDWTDKKKYELIFGEVNVFFSSFNCVNKEKEDRTVKLGTENLEL